MKIKREVFWCECSSPDHLMIMELDEWEYDVPHNKSFKTKDVMFYIQMKHFRGFFGRLAIAFKYLFKLEKDHIHYSEIIITDIEQLKKMRDVLDEAITHKGVK